MLMTPHAEKPVVNFRDLFHFCMNQADICFVWDYIAFVKSVVSFDCVMICLFEIRHIFSGQKNHPDQEIYGELDSLKTYIVPWIPKAKLPWISKSIFIGPESDHWGGLSLTN